MNNSESMSVFNSGKYIIISLKNEIISPEEIYYDLNSIIQEININQDIWVVGFDLTKVEKICDIKSSAESLNISLTKLILEIKKPVIGLVSGEISNRLFEMILPMDYRITDKKSTFIMSQIFNDNMQFDGATQLLPRIIGLNKSKELIMFGKQINSKEASEIGLVNIIVDEEKLNETFICKIELLTQFSPLAMQFTKSAINFSKETNTIRGMNMENDLYSILLSSKDRTSSINSIKNKSKRNPYSGK